MLKKSAKKILPVRLQKFLKSLFLKNRMLAERVRLLECRMEYAESNMQRILALRHERHPTPFSYEFKIFSQNGEDGVLAYLYSVIGTTNRFFVEVGSGNGKENNSANLVINGGWSGVGIDGSAENREVAKKFFERYLSKISLVQERVTVENINGILSAQHVPVEPDMLSIDIDGNDFWIWKAITGIRPRVVIMEYNGSFGKGKSITVKYDPDFNRREKHASGYYHGASIRALARLGTEKGYALIGCESAGTNAFFVRKDVLGPLKEITPEDAFVPPLWRIRRESIQAQFEKVKDLPYENYL